MDLRSATALALIFKGADEAIYEEYLKIIDTLKSKTDMLQAKSIRFEKDPMKLSSIRRTSDESFKFPSPVDTDKPVQIFRYRVANQNDVPETGYRYAIYSPYLTEIFSIRAFSDEAAYKKLLAVPKIIVEFTVTFKGASISRYKMKGSNVDRLAVFCAESRNFTEEELSEAKAFYKKTVDANKTSIFNT